MLTGCVNQLLLPLLRSAAFATFANTSTVPRQNVWFCICYASVGSMQITAWCMAFPMQVSKKLHRLQSSTVRLVWVKGYHVINTDDLWRKKLHWLPVKDHIVFKILRTYKSRNGLAPAYLSHLLSKYKHPHTLRLASMSFQFSMWYLYLFLQGTCFRLWNALPASRMHLRWLFSRNCWRLTCLKIQLFKVSLPTYHLWEQNAADDLAKSDVLVICPLQGFHLCWSHNAIFTVLFCTLQIEHVIVLFCPAS